MEIYFNDLYFNDYTLGEISSINTGTSDLKDAVDDGDYPFFVRSEKIYRSFQYIFDGEAILIPGEGKLGDIIHYIDGKFDYHQRVYKISDFALDIDGKYIYFYMQSNFKKHALKYTVKATVDSLRLDTLKNFKLSLPTYYEQVNIKNFLTNFDLLIKNTVIKVNKLRLIKKFFLKNLFVEGASKYPNIRLSLFNDAWEKRKVGEFYDFKNGLNKEKEFFGSGVPIVNFVDVFHNRGLTPEMLKGRVTLSEKEIKNFEVKQGDIFFTRTSETINEIGYPSVMLGAPTDTVFSGFVLRGRARNVDPMNNLFKRYVFLTESFRNEMVKKSSMTTRALTSGTAIKEMYVQYPTSKDEQHKIGAFLAQIDETITLYERKLELLELMKKGFLQKMFV